MVTTSDQRDTFRYRLLFVRHGETQWNAEGRLQGQRDVAINARGADQAAAAGRTLRHWLGARAPAILQETDFFASPLLRTRQTMEIVRTTLGLPPQPFHMDDRLKEIGFGVWEGWTWGEIKTRAPALFRARKADKWGFVPPEGESYAMVAERVADWLQSLCGDAIVVSHGGVARVLMHLLGGIAPGEVCDAAITQGRVIEFHAGACRWIEADGAHPVGLVKESCGSG